VKIAIVGSGALGGYFGARLMEAGEDVVFVARGTTLAALRDEGLTLESPDGDLSLAPLHAVEDPRDLHPVDAVLVTVKAWQVPAIAETIRPLVGDDTTILPLQNGVEAPEQLAAVHGRKALGGSAKIIVKTIGPGRIKHVGVRPRIVLGEMDNRRSARVEALAAVLQGAKIRAEVPEDIRRALWEKFLFMAPVAGVGAVTRSPLGTLRSTPETRIMLSGAMEEVAALATARGIPLAPDAVASALDFLDTLPAEGTSSMQRDIMKGRPSELEAHSGAVTRLGRTTGIPTPVHDFLYASLLPMETAARANG
jgi:2-dehydropantoate 2-reductase